jgi:Putative polyhydroxyalkanoic acid system protein (PHA_gran_rgn)
MEPVVIVTIPHRHGKAEATRRIKAGLEQARSRYAAQLKVAEENWDGDRLRFRAAVLGQSITGSIDVADAEVRAEATLTWLMGHLVKPAEALIRREGERMLEGS